MSCDCGVRINKNVGRGCMEKCEEWFIYRQRSNVHSWNATSPFPETPRSSLHAFYVGERFIRLDSKFVTHDVPGTSTTIANTRHQTAVLCISLYPGPTMRSRIFAKLVHERSPSLRASSLYFLSHFLFGLVARELGYIYYFLVLYLLFLQFSVYYFFIFIRHANVFQASCAFK